LNEGEQGLGQGGEAVTLPGVIDPKAEVFDDRPWAGDDEGKFLTRDGRGIGRNGRRVTNRR